MRCQLNSNEGVKTGLYTQCRGIFKAGFGLCMYNGTSTII